VVLLLLCGWGFVSAEATAAESAGPRKLDGVLAAADNELPAAVADEPLAGIPAAQRNDPLQRRLDAALAEYNPAIEKAIDELAKAIEEEFIRATKKGDIELARKCKEAEAALREQGAPPRGDFLRATRENTQRKITRAGAKLATEFEAVAKECLKAGDLDRAESVLSEKAELLAEMKEWKATHRAIGIAGRTPEPASRPPREPHSLKLYKFDGDQEANLVEARMMLLWLGATITAMDREGGWITGRLRPDLELTIWPKSLGKLRCYGVRFGNPLAGGTTEESYFEVCRDGN